MNEALDIPQQEPLSFDKEGNVTLRLTAKQFEQVVVRLHSLFGMKRELSDTEKGEVNG